MSQDKKKSEKAEQNKMAEKETVGALLRRTRLAKNQDLRDIASYLCIRYQFLVALEEGRYKELPGEAYANGFIRSYAAYLGLDSADIIARYKQEFFNSENSGGGFYVMSSEEAENIVPTPKIVIVSVVLLLAAFGLWQSSSGKDDRSAPPVVSEQADQISVVEEVYPLPQTEASIETSEENETENTKEAPVPPVPPVKPEYEEKEENSAENAVAEQEKAGKKEPVFQPPRVYGQKNSNPRLILIAKEDVWIEITRSGTVVFSHLLKRGDQYMVSSHNPEELFLKTGNAGGLEVYCDGKLTQALGPRGALRSNVALIPDDFAAKVVEDIE